ncbi:MAG: DUF1211 domain-containing protein [Microbacteriaceae bacterium]|nr:DUF1211 domain-containing protein [Microbacteriaceae bacterium]
MPEAGEREGVASRARRLFGRGDGAERIAAYSDGVFAIAMTLLVLDIVVPDGSTSAAQVLAEEWPSYVAFALSFVIVALAWVGHHRRFRVVVGHDVGLLWLNLLLLLFVVSMPFPTSLISAFAPETAAVVVYAAAIALLQLGALAQWWYCWRRGLLAPSVDRGVFLVVVWDLLPVIAVFLVSVPIALLWGGEPAMWSWAASIVLSPLVGVVARRTLDARR